MCSFIDVRKQRQGHRKVFTLIIFLINPKGVPQYQADHFNETLKNTTFLAISDCFNSPLNTLQTRYDETYSNKYAFPQNSVRNRNETHYLTRHVLIDLETVTITTYPSND